MNNEQRKKLKILKYANEENIKKIQWKNNILLQECLNNLETYQIISDDAIIRQIVKIASGIEIKRRFHSDIPMIEKNHDYYIVWDNERVPIIKCKGNDIIENWDDVLAVAFDTCFVDCRTEQVFLSESEIPFYCKVAHKEKLEFTQKPENSEPGFFFLYRQKENPSPSKREKGITVILLPPLALWFPMPQSIS